MKWYIMIDVDPQEKVAIKYAALEAGVSIKEWVRGILLDVVYPKPTQDKEPETEVLNGLTITLDGQPINRVNVIEED